MICNQLKGKIIEKVEGLERGNEMVTFYCSDNSVFKWFPDNKGETIDVIIGDANILLNHYITYISEVNIPIPGNNNPTCYVFSTYRGWLWVSWT